MSSVDDLDADRAEPSAPDETRWHRAWRAVRVPVLGFVAVGIVLYAVVWFSAAGLERKPDYAIPPADFTGSSVLEGWYRFDGGWYASIARDGYFYSGPDQQAPVAYFPAYPLAMRAAHVVTKDWPLAGIVLTAACGLGVAILFYRWCRMRFDQDTARTALVVLLVYPYAWYLFGAVYADALFLVSVLGAFVLVERDHPVLAGMVGIVATAARPVGVALVVGLVAVVLQRRGSLRALRPGDAGVLLSAGGLIAWMAFLWHRWGDPLLFASVQGAPGWDQQEGPSTWFKVTFLQRLRHLPFWLADSLGGTTAHDPKPWTESTYTLGLILQALLMLGALALVWLVWRRVGWGYALYVVGVVAVPLLGSKDFQGVGRYLLAAFPCFAVLGALLANRTVARRAWLVVSTSLLVLLASAYARGYYVA